MNTHTTSHIGYMEADLFIGAAQSLKDKRMVVKSIKDRIHNKFNASVAEIGGQDKWQTATLGVVMIGSDQKYVDGGLQKIVEFIESNPQINLGEYSIQFL